MNPKASYNPIDADVDVDVLCALVAPWLPDATVESARLERSCGCYSEWTTEPPRFEVTFRAPRPTEESDVKLSKVVSVLESVVEKWATATYSFSGCSCCCDDNDLDNVTPSIWVRVIRERKDRADG